MLGVGGGGARLHIGHLPVVLYGTCTGQCERKNAMVYRYCTCIGKNLVLFMLRLQVGIN